MTAISVIAPFRNEENNLPGFLQSLKRQVFTDFETVLLDSDSTDKSFRIVFEAIKHSNLRLVYHNVKIRRLGYIRNVGADLSRGKILFHTSSDISLPPDLLGYIYDNFFFDDDLLALTGRTYPVGTTALGHLAYQGFDLIRYSASLVNRFRPSANFVAVRKEIYRSIGGFPNTRINEGEEIGKRLEAYVKERGGNLKVNLHLYINHRDKRFAGVKGLGHYLYVFSNFLPIPERVTRILKKYGEIKL